MFAECCFAIGVAAIHAMGKAAISVDKGARRYFGADIRMRVLTCGQIR